MATGVTYAEIRQTAVYLRLFTARDLAAVMRVDLEVGKRGVKALRWHGIIEPTGDFAPTQNGDGPEAIWRYKPLPPGPRIHHTKVPPERVVGYTEILSPRGVTVAGISGGTTKGVRKTKRSTVGRGGGRTQGPKRRSDFEGK